MTQTRAAAFAATCWLERSFESENLVNKNNNNNKMTNRMKKFSKISITLVVIIMISLISLQVSAIVSLSSAAIQAEQLIGHSFGAHAPLSLAGAQFDASQFKSVHEAIKAHPDLRQVSNEQEFEKKLTISLQAYYKRNEQKVTRTKRRAFACVSSKYCV